MSYPSPLEDPGANNLGALEHVVSRSFGEAALHVGADHVLVVALVARELAARVAGVRRHVAKV